MNIFDHGWWLKFFMEVGVNWITWLLVMMLFLITGVLLERLVYIALRQGRHEDLERLITLAFGQKPDNAAKAQLEAALKSKSVPARVLDDGYHAARHGEPEKARQLMQAALRKEKLKLERGVAFIGTVGNNAPFVGLFGTVLGIIRSFQDLSHNITEGSTAVMAGIAEALVATAIGLMVALPAVIIFNFLQRQIKTILSLTESASEVLVAYSPAKPPLGPETSAVSADSGPKTAAAEKELKLDSALKPAEN